MRDYALIAVIFACLPMVLFRPHVGILLWCWISYMNPHRLTWGVAFDFRFAMLIGLVTLLVWLYSRESKAIPLRGPVVLLALLAIWMIITTFFAIVPDAAQQRLDKALKIILMTFVTVALINSRERLHAFVWIIVISLGYFGVKGGIWVLLGGGGRVWGPPGGFIEDNNALALALVMTLPLMRYLQLHSCHAWIRWGMAGAIIVSAVSIMGSYSRGAFLAASAAVLYTVLKSRNRIPLLLAIALLLGAGSLFVPQRWYDRIGTIQTYEEDESAMSRIYAWTFAVKVALDRPVVGGGFNVFEDLALYTHYVPEQRLGQNFHSVYFQMLGEHGFVGLTLFLMFLYSGYRTAGRVVRLARGRAELRWALDLAAMTQVSLVAFAVGGAFQNLALFDLFYHLVIIALILLLNVEKQCSHSIVPDAKPLIRSGPPPSYQVGPRPSA